MDNAKKYIKKGWFYPATVELSEMFISLSPEEKTALNPNNFLSKKQLISVYEGILEDREQIENILSFGSRWDEDELLLVFSNFIKLKVLSYYFSYFGMVLNLNFKELKIIIKNIDKTKNKTAITLSLNLIRKNSPLESVYGYKEIASVLNWKD